MNYKRQNKCSAFRDSLPRLVCNIKSVKQTISLTFNVAPFGPRSLCLLFTNLSLLRTKDPVFIMSHATSSSKTR